MLYREQRKSVHKQYRDYKDRLKKYRNNKYGTKVYSTKTIVSGNGYKSFLKSSFWKNARNNKLKRNSSCEACGSLDNLNVHHSSYKNKNRANVSDFIDDLYTLCRSCHESFHSKHGVKEDMTNETKDFILETKSNINNSHKIALELDEGFNRLII